MRKVLKFGGSSVANSERIETVLELVRSSMSAAQVQAVVVSAFRGDTDGLIELSHLAAQGDESYRDKIGALEARYLEVLRHFVPATDQSGALLQLKLSFNELEDILNGISLVGEVSKRLLDKVMSFGELLSALIISECAKARGIDCEFLDARHIIRTDSNFGAARVDFGATDSQIAAYFETHRLLQLTTGFIAADGHGDTTTLGRGGSDYTASILGAALQVDEIEIWTDVDGMMTADPRKVRKSFPQLWVSYSEALELSHFGAKVIHPPSIQPALVRSVPVRILNTFNPDFPGTLISRHAHKPSALVTGVSSIPDIALLRVQGSGMVGVAGISMRLFGALARANISVILISQASSEHTICLAVRPEEAQKAREAINSEFALEIGASLIEEAIVETELSVISVVGENMQKTPGIAGKIFGALGKNGVNVVAIAQGSSELNISAVTSSADEVKALNALHEELFFPDTKAVNVFLAGTGLIGTALLRQIQEHRQHLSEKMGHEVRVLGIANSRKMVTDESGIPLDHWQKLLKEGCPKNGLQDFVAELKRLNLPSSVFVDCTASEEVAAAYEGLLKSSISVVTPNKRAQCGPYEYYVRLKQASSKRGVQLLFETSVGAGLPVISTLNDLLKSGDSIVSIEAVLSGTLSYIFHSFGPGKPFSEVVLSAKQAGYTEPDPRDDLNGLDVARKMLILAREAGCQMEMTAVEVENLISAECRAAKSVEEFFLRLKELDGYFEDRRRRAAEVGRKLCYIARLASGRVNVALKEIDSSHPFYGLSGSENIISFTTKRYSNRPLVVKGPGAGAEVTAAGVFADILRLAS